MHRRGAARTYITSACSGGERSTGSDGDTTADGVDTATQCMPQNEMCGSQLESCCGSLVCRTRFNDRFESKSLCVEAQAPGSVGGPRLPGGFCHSVIVCDRGLCPMIDTQGRPGLVGGPCYDNGTCNPGIRCTDGGQCEAQEGCLLAQAACSTATGFVQCCTPFASCATPDHGDEGRCCVGQGSRCEHSDDCCTGLECWKWTDGGSSICDVF